MAFLEAIRPFRIFDFDIVPRVRGGPNISILKNGLQAVEKTHEGFAHSEIDVAYIVISADGIPWKEATLFLLSMLKGLGLPESSTLKNVAQDLVVFKNWLESEGVDCLDVENMHRLALPTYKYQRFLRDTILSGRIGSGTAKRRMRVVIRFYSFLQDNDLISTRSLWVTKSKKIYDRKSSRRQVRDFLTTDLTRNLNVGRVSSSRTDGVKHLLKPMM